MARPTRRRRPLAGTRDFIAYRWPTYLFLYGGGALLALVGAFVATALDRQWLAVVALGAFALLAYFFMTSLWAAYLLYDRREYRADHLLFHHGRLQPTSRFVHIGLGRRETPARLSRRLTGGHVRVIDIYNPQLMPGSALARSRRRHTAPDPRITWLDGTFDLLPLADKSVWTLTANRTLSQFQDHGDRVLLLEQLFRVLEPGGQLIVIEPVRTSFALLIWGPAALEEEPPLYWQSLFHDAGFLVREERMIHGLAMLFVLEKPLPGEIQQLRFNFGV
ncbi:MAG: class I SAM-dependent methyltransferase [Candidatus Promineifilaceae bacterium]|nr:class I SAM-dependent methyltransferase [Candidatus Promineifilaceae bacterium]